MLACLARSYLHLGSNFQDQPPRMHYVFPDFVTAMEVSAHACNPNYLHQKTDCPKVIRYNPWNCRKLGLQVGYKAVCHGVKGSKDGGLGFRV